MIVHFIVNSHLDPVWLWKREQGIDEVLSTARTACELLDEYPEYRAYLPEVTEEIVRDTIAKLGMRVRTQDVVDLVMGRYRLIGR